MKSRIFVFAFILMYSLALTMLPVTAFAIVIAPFAPIEVVPILPPTTLPEAVWNGSADQNWSGSGSQASPFLITTAEELAGLAVKVNAGNLYQGKYFKLTANVRLVKDTLRLWTPIGNKNNMFRGHFNGNGRVVAGLYFSNKYADYVGLFGAVGTGGSVSNLGVLEGIIYADEKVGGIAGYSLGLIQNCFNTCTIPSYGDYVGGIVGYSGGSVIDCYNTGRIVTSGSSPDYVGGVVGYAENGVVIGCYNTAEVRARYKAGGVVGAIGGGALVFNCWNKGKIYTSSTRTGGIVGNSGAGCVVANCYNTGDVSADGKVGGIVGYSHGAMTINCYNTGYINSHGEDRPAAIVGYPDDVAGSFEILGRGHTIKASYVINCYYLTGSASIAWSGDPSTFSSGMGRFTSPNSTIIRYDAGGSSSGWFLDLVDSLDEALVDVIDTAFNIVGAETPESLKKLVALNYHEPFPGNTTIYSGTLLAVLNAGVSGDSGSYGRWYQYNDTNNGYPVLLNKSNPAFIPIMPGGLRPIDWVKLVPFESAVEAESQADIQSNSGVFALSPNYPVDRVISVGQDAGFSTSRAPASIYTGALDMAWYVIFENDEYSIDEAMEMFGCTFAFVNSNHLVVTATPQAVSGIYKIYCVVSNATHTVSSRKAVLTVHGLQAMPYTFPFTDVSDNAWYRNDVEIAHKNGLINGKTATAYVPNDNMTIAEAIKLAACMHQLYHAGAVTLTNGSPSWYSSYVDYALANSIISSPYPDYNARITRREFVHVFYSALPSIEYTGINSVADNAIPDVHLSDAYRGEIYTFYRAGILVGSDSIGTFSPTSQIRRSEVAAILTRMFDDTARKRITLP